MNGERNLQLIREIEANREFLLLLYGQNPDLLARTEPRIRQLFEPLPGAEKKMLSASTTPRQQTAPRR